MQNCKVCSKQFQRIGKAGTYKVCSYECSLILKKMWLDSYKEKTCKMCGGKFSAQRKNISMRKYCNGCTNIAKSNAKKKENNPNWKGGVKKKKVYSTKMRRHNFVCRQYKKVFLEENEYLYCEVCKVSNPMTAFRFEVHHIYYASKFPGHENLHHPNNLILICHHCHVKFHSGEYKDKFKLLEEQRGLKQLFLSSKSSSSSPVFNYRKEGKSMLARGSDGRYFNKSHE